jgi:proline dehydrogenase
MEGSPYTEATIATTERLRSFRQVGTALQAHFRTDTDTERLLGQEFAFACKGALKKVRGRLPKPTSTPTTSTR